MPKPRKERTRAYIRDDFAAEFARQVEKTAGLKLSRRDAWILGRLAFATLFELAERRRVTLAGFLSAEAVVSKRVVKSGGHPRRMRLKAAEGVNRLMAEGKPIAESLMHLTDDGGDPVEFGGTWDIDEDDEDNE
jgi:hypothetical protein